jgi:hypothetical protein
MLGYNPATTVFGIEPAVINISMDLSPQVDEKFPRLVELIQQEILKILEN